MPLDPARLAETKYLARTAMSLIDALNAASRDTDARTACKALQAAADSLRAHITPQRVTPAPKGLTPASATGCTTHPLGPVDHDPPDGWTNCLLCNGRRRRAQRAPRPPELTPPGRTR